VKAAIASAASQYLLHEPASWALLQQAVHDSAATAAVLAQRPAYGMALKYRSRYADLLVAVTNRAEPEVVRPAVRALARWARWNPSIAPVCAGFITDLTARTTWNDATTALVAIVAGDPRLGLGDLLAAVRLLVRLESDPNLPNATADRDHPARQRLGALVKRLNRAFEEKPADSRRVLELVAAELDGPDLLEFRLDLLVAAIAWPELAAKVPALVDAVADSPLAAHHAASLVGDRLDWTDAQWTPDLVEPVARELVQGESLMEGLLAEAIVGAAGGRANWPSGWRELLVALRNHPRPDVRRKALDLTTAAEV